MITRLKSKKGEGELVEANSKLGSRIWARGKTRASMKSEERPFKPPPFEESNIEQELKELKNMFQ